MDTSSSAWLGLAGSALASTFNYSATAATNKRGEKIARENNALQERLFNQQLDFNREMSQQSHDWNVEFWNMQNEYNTPINTMNRLKAAGLNPNLVYGSGSATTPAGAISAARTSSAPSAPHAQAPSLSAPRIDVGSFASALMSLETQKNEVDRGKLENQALANRNSVFALQRQDMELEVAIKGLSLAKSQTEKDYWRDIIESNLKVNSSTYSRNMAAAANSDSLTALNESVMPDYYSARTAESRANVNRSFSDIALNNAKVALAMTQARNELYELEVIKPVKASKLWEELKLVSQNLLNAQTDNEVKKARLRYHQIEANIAEDTEDYEALRKVLIPFDMLFGTIGRLMGGAGSLLSGSSKSKK